jgi:type III pantothenate kinase
MNLVIDIGNTSVKLHLFENDEKIISKTLNENTLIASLTTLEVKYSIQNVIISSVTSNYKTELTKIFKIQTCLTFPMIKLNYRLLIAIKIQDL